MLNQIKGLHHVTSLASSAQDNNAFFTHVLGLRRVKKTVNFDAPDVYHLYYGDEKGTPGTVMTYFPFPHAARGRRGTGEVGVTYFTPSPRAPVMPGPNGSPPSTRPPSPATPALAKTVCSSTAPTATVSRWSNATTTAPPGPATASAPTWPSAGSTAPTCACATPAPRPSCCASWVTRKSPGWCGAPLRRLGRQRGQRDRRGNPARRRPCVAGRGVRPPHRLCRRQPRRQLEVREALRDTGWQVTPPIDRDYFWAIYFRTPRGVLFEVATNEPGFDRDEDTAHLGQALKLPAQHEHLRARLERALEPIAD